MTEARSLLMDLWSKGVELRVENGGLQAKSTKLMSPAEWQHLSASKQDVIHLLRGEAAFLEPNVIAHIKRLASRIGTVVECGGKKGLLIGVFRDRAVVDTGKVILSVNHEDVSLRITC